MALIVQKFGGSSVRDRDRIFNVARIVSNTRKAGNDVVVVVSAQGDTTDDLIEKAKEDGFVLTVFNRRRFIPEIKSSNKIVKALGERLAMNAPIQGSAADIIKVAMVNVYNKLKENEMKSKLILQVHDELIVEAVDEELELAEKIVREEMENAQSMDVKLDVDLNTGNSWYETK